MKFRMGCIASLVLGMSLWSATGSANIGFEYETGIFLESGPLTFGKKKAAVLERGTPVAGSTAIPWEMQLDEHPDGNKYDIELVVPPKDGYPNARLADYRLVCDSLAGLYAHMTGLRTQVRALDGTPGNGMKSFEYRDSRDRKFVLKTNSFRDIGGNPQVTIGLPYDRVFQFFRLLANDVAFASLYNYFNGSPVVHHQRLIQTIDRQAGLSERGKAFMLFTTDVVCGGAKQNRPYVYAKAQLTNLMRSNMGTLYQLLPAADKAFIASQDPDGNGPRGLIRLAQQLGTTAQCLPPGRNFEGDKLFAAGWEKPENRRLMAITRIAYAEALMTSGDDPLKGKDFEGLSRLPAAEQDVVFEVRKVRRIEGQNAIEQLIERALDMYDFVYRLRNAAPGAPVAFQAGVNRAKAANDATKCVIPGMP